MVTLAKRPDVLYLSPKNTAALALSSKGENLYRKELIYVGQFTKKIGTDEKKFNVTEDTLHHWHNTHLALSGNGVTVPLQVEHDESPEETRGKMVATDVALNDKGIPAIFGHFSFDKPEYADDFKNRDVSIFVPGEWTDGKNNTYNAPIRHVALTSFPIIPGLGKFQSLAASFQEPKTMAIDPKKLAAKLGVPADTADDQLETALETAIDDLMKKVEAVKASEDGDKETDKTKDEVKLSGALVSMLSENRDNKIKNLVSIGAITPAVAKDMRDEFCNPKTLSLALSAKDGETTDGFNRTVAMLEKNAGAHKKPEGVEKTGQQGDLELSNVTNPEKNPLLADAERRRKEAANK